MNIELVDSPNPELLNFFQDRIDEFNVARWEIKEKFPVAVKVTDESGAVVGGGTARTFGFWLLIDNIWVSSDLRGKDVGSHVLSKLESAALNRGCKFALLDTLNFQAKPFYEKHGYKVHWTQTNYPKDGCKYFMTKDL